MSNNRTTLFKFILILILTFVIGCAPSKSLLMRISLDNTKETVLKQVGEPLAVRGAIKNKFGQIVEVWEYRFCSGGEIDIPPYSSNCDYYWLYFVDGVLAQWGEAGDWEKEADRIYEFRIR